jgi:hypothetical protein
MPGSVPNQVPVGPIYNMGLGTMYPGGVNQIVANTLANPTVVSTLAPHGLATGDTVFFTASTTSVPSLTVTPQQVVTVISTTTFSVPVNVTTAGTAGAYDYAIVSIPTTPGAAPLVNCGTAHGLRVGDTVTITASGSTPSLDGAQVVTAIDDPRSFRVLTSAAPTTIAGSTTAAHFSKTIYYSDTWDRGDRGLAAGVVLTSVVSTAPATTLVDIQGTWDLVNWHNVAYSTMAAPQTLLYAQLTITTSTATSYKLPGVDDAGSTPWRWLRLKFTSNTNVIMSAQAHQTRAG